MNKSIPIRIITACVLAFYLMMPHAALGFTSTGCTCIEEGLKCGQGGLLCHCCKDRGAVSVKGTMISKCHDTHADYNIAHPPAVLVSSFITLTGPEHAKLSGASNSLLYDTANTPPLRPPESLPFY